MNTILVVLSLEIDKYYTVNKWTCFHFGRSEWIDITVIILSSSFCSSCLYLLFIIILDIVHIIIWLIHTVCILLMRIRTYEVLLMLHYDVLIMMLYVMMDFSYQVSEPCVWECVERSAVHSRVLCLECFNDGVNMFI